MPTVQSKIKVDSKKPPETARQPSSRRNASRKNAENHEPRKPKKGPKRGKRTDASVELNSTSSQVKNRKNYNFLAGKMSPIPTDESSTTQAPPVAIESSNRNINLLDLKELHIEDRETCSLDELKTSASHFDLFSSRTPSNSLLDFEIDDNFLECNELEKFIQTQYPDFKQSPEFQTPNFSEEFDFSSIPSTSTENCNLNKCSGELCHFKELLHQEQCSKSSLLEPDKLLLIKDVVNADEKHQALRRDDYNQLKEILEGQLKEVSEQRHLIQMLLSRFPGQDNKQVEVTTMKVDTAEQPMEKETSQKLRATNYSIERSETYHTPRQEVDIIFKNVPSLENEICILRSLGIKLAETLKKSSLRQVEKPPLIRYVAVSRYYRCILHNASVILIPMAIKLDVGLAREFQIRFRTIGELKLEKEFYIPTDDVDNFTLHKTNFYSLSRNPELLLRQLQPTANNPGMKFNIIEQDPIFFNHFLAKMCKISSESIDQPGIYIPQNDNFLKRICYQKTSPTKTGSGDHLDVEFKDIKPPNLNRTHNRSTTATFRNKMKKTDNQTSSQQGNVVTAKNSLIRTFLLGVVQLALILTVLTAFFYPDLVCF